MFFLRHLPLSTDKIRVHSLTCPDLSVQVGSFLHLHITVWITQKTLSEYIWLCSCVKSIIYGSLGDIEISWIENKISLSGASISVLPAVVLKIFSYQWNCLKNWSHVVSSLLLTTMVEFSWYQEGTFSWLKKTTEARCCLWIGTEFCTKHIDHLVFIYPQAVLGSIVQKERIHH